MVIFHLKRKLHLGEFFRMINNKPLAASLLEVYCKEQDQELLKDFYYQDDRKIESANMIFSEAYNLDVILIKERKKKSISLYILFFADFILLLLLFMIMMMIIFRMLMNELVN